MAFDLQALGARVRAIRGERGLTSRALAAASGVSVRFLSELENGRGNISVTRLAALADAMDVPMIRLVDVAHGRANAAQRDLAEHVLSLSPMEFDRVRLSLDTALEGEGGRPQILALLGVRGAGKSTIGAQVAETMGVPFVELDALIEAEAGLSLGELFAIHGEDYYREVELRVLDRFLAQGGDAVLATGGSLVSHGESWQRLQGGATTVWLRAEARALWERVVAQGDLRPMAEHENAFVQLEALVEARAPLYGRADFAVETTGIAVEAVAIEVARAVDFRAC
jgi:XRE family aerobic/anaerobic benzoate catabolism transcriptional regulator